MGGVDNTGRKVVKKYKEWVEKEYRSVGGHKNVSTRIDLQERMDFRICDGKNV